MFQNLAYRPTVYENWPHHCGLPLTKIDFLLNPIPKLQYRRTEKIAQSNVICARSSSEGNQPDAISSIMAKFEMGIKIICKWDFHFPTGYCQKHIFLLCARSTLCTMYIFAVLFT